MTKKIFQIALILFVLGNTSCKKWLDLEPQDGITKGEFWKTKEDVKAALTGIYSSMVEGGVEERIFLWGELRGDMINVTINALDDYKQVRNSNILTTNYISNWGSLYRVINNCNLLIDFAGDAKALDPTFTEEQYNSYIGEALAIRSLMYFYLVRSFRDVPLKLKGSYKDSDVPEIGKSSDKEVLAQIIGDLNKARTMVPNRHGNSDQVNKGRITKYGIYALLADVYLWNEQYAEADKAADSVLINPDFKIVPASGGWFGNVFEQGSSTETIFELSHRSSVESIFYGMLADSRRLFTSSELVPENIFIPNSLVDVDLVDGRNLFYSSSGTIEKYGTTRPSFFNFQVYRITDVMLIKAEAINQLGEGVEALNIVKNIREFRNALDATDPGVSDDDTEGIHSFILNERAREFAFEGKRWFDLLRTAKRQDYIDPSILRELITNISDASVQQSALNKIRDVNSHYFPISETELFADTKLVQNPFYLK
jgi:hypothetical protein